MVKKSSILVRTIWQYMYQNFLNVFINRQQCVVGTQFWPDGSKYEGQFDNDLRHGDGQHIWANQEVI